MSDTSFLETLENVIGERLAAGSDGSYTARLAAQGTIKVAQKVGEEAVELVIEAKDNDKEKFLGEAADLMYHYMVLLSAKDFTLNDVLSVLKQRHSK